MVISAKSEKHKNKIKIRLQLWPGICDDERQTSIVLSISLEEIVST